MGWPNNYVQGVYNSGNELVGIDDGAGGSIGLARTYTWATKPLASDYIGTAFISDIGIGGSYWISNGAVWKPLNGYVVIAESAVAGTAHTGTLVDTTLLTVPLVANILGLTGTIVVETKITANIITTTSVIYAKLGGTVFSGIGTGVVTTCGIGHKYECQNRNSQTSKLGSNGTVHGYGTGAAWTTLSINTAIDRDLTLTCAHGNVGSTVTLESYRISLVYP
jgi:hypothetical protein